MPLKKFETIRQSVQFNDNDKHLLRDPPNHDRLHKIRPLYDELNKSFAKVPLERPLSIHEQICSTKWDKIVLLSFSKSTGIEGGSGSPLVKVTDHGRHVMSSIPISLKARRVGQRCTLHLSRAETSSRWCGVVVRRLESQLRCRPCHLAMVQNYVIRHQNPSCS
ncbi:uncharacterized protein TNCV_1867731 [Trichonephila clavipes]|nr:uncharacterized protein TNCV_1867731 [Trichonephila clavipes]